MSDHVPEATGDLDELLQIDEVPLPSTVPVRVTEAIGVYQLPNRRARIDETTVDDVNWAQVVDGSKKRACGTLIAAGNPIRIRVSSSGDGMAWPVGVPYTFKHTLNVFVKCATAAQTSTVGVTEEFWAD